MDRLFKTDKEFIALLATLTSDAKAKGSLTDEEV